MSKHDDNIHAVFFIWLIILSLILLFGCSTVTPYVSAVHIDSTPFEKGSHDADTFGCIGIKVRTRVSFKSAWCKSANNIDVLNVGVEYDLFSVR